MTIPTGVATVTVTLDLGAGGVAAGPGSVEFAPSVPVAYVGPAWVNTLAPFSAAISGGVGSIVLPATDDAAGNPDSWTYLVTERFGGSRQPFNIAVLSVDGAVQDYSTLVPIPSSNGIAVVRGAPGPAGTPGAGGVPPWAPDTVYALGQQIASPNNDVVSRIAAGTSGATYDASQWSVSSTYVQPGQVAPLITVQPPIPLAFVVVDQDDRRTEIEVGTDGRFTQRVIDSLAGRIAGSVPEVVAARGSQASLAARLDHGLTAYGSPRGYVTGEWNLRWTRMLTRRLLYGNTGTQLKIACIGDSYTHDPIRWTRPFWTAMKTLYGDGPVGWVGFSNAAGTGGINGSARNDVTVVETGTWTDTYTGTKSPDLGEEFSSTAGDTIVVTFPAGQASVDLFSIGNADGSMTYQFNGGGTSQSLSLIDTAALHISALTGITSTSTTLTITVVSGTVRLCGVNIKGTQNGVVVSQLGSSGSQAYHWAAVDPTSWRAGIASLNPDLVIVMLGVNDQGSKTAAEFATSMQTILTNLRAALGPTGFDPLIVMPPEQQRTGLVGAMADYAAAALPLADTNQCAYIDTQLLFGVDPADYAYGSARPWFAADLVHPDPATGGRVLADAVIRVVTER